MICGFGLSAVLPGQMRPRLHLCGSSTPEEALALTALPNLMSYVTMHHVPRTLGGWTDGAWLQCPPKDIADVVGVYPS
jgi:hypothetical protein